MHFTIGCTGEVSVECRGPTKPAHCELDDRKDGTFELIMKPQEAGNHTLQIKFNCEHVPGKDDSVQLLIVMCLEYVFSYIFVYYIHIHTCIHTNRTLALPYYKLVCSEILQGVHSH